MKKSLYIFLCSILGVLLFLIIHQLLVFVYLLLIIGNPQIFGLGLNYLEVLAIDAFTLILALFLGAWYGIWLGLKWYEVVYETKEQGGFVDHVVKTYWPCQKSAYSLTDRVRNIGEELKADVLEFEHLAKTIKPVMKQVVPIKRRIVRKRSAVKQ